MAQTGYTPISIYYSATTTNVPTAGNLVAGELAINTADGKLFYKDSAGVVQTIASKATGTVAGSTTQIIYNNAGSYAGSANLVFTSTGLGVGTSSPTQKFEALSAFGYNSGIQNIAVLTHDAGGNAPIDGSGPALRLDYIGGASPTRYQMGQIGGAFITSGLGNQASGLYLNTVNTSNTLATAAIVTNSGIGLGNNIPSSGVGIRFPATQSASSDANTLDDYEEGTFTVTLVCGTSGTITVSSSFNTLTYTKVGRAVTISGLFSTSAISSPVGTLRMAGLPFITATGNQFRGGGGYYLNGAAATATTYPSWGGVSADTTVNLYTRYAAGSTTSNAADITGATDFFISFTYFTT